ncbi:hypothetical protein ANCDUO_12102 [Ancylostoma duodenale]|uniref:Nucleotide-diphospho-sugar transferase domain-containing protein n=1 Tax=Ancylostoma duodenale TaxID=51022 RepID=A0A0C2CM80_9BILA|nr:hypothetical protein ANCDUO_12102 [Ancylostoma duodenale]
MKCYAQSQSYDLLIFHDSHFVNECRQDHIQFRRHCMVVQVLDNYDYVLFVDSDIMVVNPQKRIEEFIDPSADIIFYDRFYNWEVAMGSYIVRNTSWSRQFFLGLAAYYKPYPIMMRRNDNIALMGTAWVRDIWLSNSLWSREGDFMLHGCKERQKSSYNSTPPRLGIADPGGVWYNPFAGSIDLNRCTPGNTSWNYDENLIVKKEDIDIQLRLYSSKVEKEKAMFVDLLKKTLLPKRHIEPYLIKRNL